MKVKLIDYTQNAEALVATGARVCYSATEVDKLFDDIKDNKETQQKMIKKVIESKHMSCLEHIYFTFVIGDVSRIMSHQFVRHRLMSPHERSQRYVNLNKINDGENYCVIPDTILVNSDALCTFLDAIEEAKFAYDKMTQAGIPEEDARYVLPGATKTALIASFNGRSLIHFLRLRCCCYDAETEVLTNQGWKFFKDLDGDELFYSLNLDTKNVEYTKAIRYINEKYTGPMIKVKSQSINLLVTPNHKNVVSYQYKDPDKDIKFILDDAFNHFDHRNVMMKKNCNPIKGKKTDTFIIPGLIAVHHNQFKEWEEIIPDKEVDIKLFMQFLGMWLSDGYITKGGFHRIIGIVKGDLAKIEKYKSILEKLTDNKVKIVIDNRWVNPVYKIECHDRRLYAFLKKFGKAKHKYIPNEFFEYDYTILEYLHQGFLDGDFSKTGKTISTISKQLANDLQRLYLHLGISASIKIYDHRNVEPSGVRMADGSIYYIKNKNIVYTLTLNYSKNEPSIKNSRHDPFKPVFYIGRIHCVELEKNHTLYVRRHGKCVWSGNSRAMTETRKVAIEMLKQVRAVCPTIFDNVGPGCYMDGKCPEGKMCCGKAEEVKLKFCEY